jgi:hypothetical protein
VARANNPIEHDQRIGLLAATGELPVWIGLGAGALVCAIVGKAAGILVGVVVALTLVGIWMAVLLKLEARHLQCSCERCKAVVPFRVTLTRQRRGSAADSAAKIQ